MRKWFGGMLVVSVIPIIFYLHTFGIGLWEKNEDWAYLGSFLGGVLGPAFTFMSVLLLVMTLRETQQSNKSQLELAHKQHFENYFFNSLTTVKLSLESLRYGRSTRVDEQFDNFFSVANIWVVNNFSCQLNMDYYEDAWETAKIFIRLHEQVFDSEITLLVPLLLKVRDMPKDRQQHYLTLIKGLIDNDKRFWLEVYGMVWSPELEFALKGINFSNLPKNIRNKVLEIESNGKNI